MDKSHVGMGYSICPVCGIKHNDIILLDTRLKNTLEFNNFLGWKICVPHQEQIDNGYVHLIVCKNKNQTSFIKLEDADRTGEIISIKKNVLKDLINRDHSNFIFIDEEFRDALINLKERDESNDNKES